MALFKDRNFENEVVNFDDNTYENCKLTKCQIVYSGGPLPKLINCNLEYSDFVFAGAAQRTLEFMHMIGKSGGENVVKQIFDQILSTQSDQKA